VHEVSPATSAAAITENMESKCAEGLTYLADGPDERCDILVHLTPIVVTITRHTVWTTEGVIDAQMSDLSEPGESPQIQRQPGPNREMDGRDA